MYKATVTWKVDGTETVREYYNAISLIAYITAVEAIWMGEVVEYAQSVTIVVELV